MEITEGVPPDGYEQVLICHDAATKLHSIIVVHDTTLGPALGGVRMMPYPSEADALRDCLRLAQGMTYKAAAAGVSLGGGKSVIIGDPAGKTDELIQAHGRFIQSLGGRYIPGIDIGTEMADMRVLAREVTTVSCAQGDPSPMTALGVLSGVHACAEDVFGSADLTGLHVAIQGVGHVGRSLAELLSSEGASLTVADIDDGRARVVAESLGAEVVSIEQITAVPCDVFAPCAVGAVVNDETLPRLKCRIVAGSANNVLAEPRHGRQLHELGVLYAPDYFVNAGGLIYLEEEILGHAPDTAAARVRGIRHTIGELIGQARREDVAISDLADRLTLQRIIDAR